MMHLLNYIMTCQKHILMNTMIYQMQKEVKYIPNMFLLIQHLMNMTILSGLKRKELDNSPPLIGDEKEEKEGKGLTVNQNSNIISKNKKQEIIQTN